jgi:(4-O-methyl)-D-glucuronate---lignin esterase
MKSKHFLLCVLASVFLVSTNFAAPTESLESGFHNPPNSAKPQTWWHWMNGNITKAGIAADLEAMKQIGLGSATIVNVDCGIPAGPVPFMNSEWRDDFKFAVQEANRLGLKICVANAPGWSNTGGPWITATNAMQCVTTSEMHVTGPTNFDAALPQPPTKLDFYRDIAVLAYPAPKGSATITNLDAKDCRINRAVLSSPDASDSTVGAVSQRKIVNLTSRLDADGKLRWRVPAGKWVILRVGYTPTGVENHPAPAGGSGLECDKLSQAGMDAHWAGFLQKILDDVGPLAGKTLDASLIDSYEVGGQNWTKNFRGEFEKRRGYDPLKFLPAFTGQVVDNPAVTERFLWDVRRTVADLFAENYFGHFTALCDQHGLKSHVEPYTGPFESLQSGAPVDVVMGEFWSGSHGSSSIKLAASVAHIYGKTIVGAESFTASPEHGKWQNYPYKLKPLGDLMFCEGVNRYTFHRYAMQPWTNRWPGMTMGQWGIHFERTETWWNEGKPWIDYISRCEFLLQQGRAVEDVAYFDGQSAPVEMRPCQPPLPSGYDYDAVDADVLQHATVQNGRLTLASGANYAALILPPEDINMTPRMMECLRKLVRDGATVVGPRPQHSPSLDNYPECDAQVKKIADELWGNCDGKTVLEHNYGKGRIVWGKSLADVFAEQNLKPDFEFQGASAATDLAYTHRVDGSADIYFVSNQRRQFDSADCTFRVSGKIPELWRPDTGVIETAPIWNEHDGRTTVQLNFNPAGSVFVIFRHAADSADHIVAISGSFIAKPAARPKLKILHAVYAAIDGAGEMNVTAKLSQMVRGGQLVVEASNDTFGRDPAVNHKKELRVDYTLDGKPGHAVVRENGTLTLPPNLSIGQAPQWEASIAADGSPVVTAWSDGHVELRTADGKMLHANATDLPAPEKITGEWNLSFPPNWGAPPSVTLDKLISWTDSTNAGVRYFSGTATYEKEIEIPAERLNSGRELWLDLGTVKDFAEVSLNGHDFGVLWKPPFRVNITGVAKPGANKLTVKVTNLWPNRLIGDEQLPSDVEWNGKGLKQWPQWLLDGKPSPHGRLTFTTWHHYTKDSPLLESGLIGPVKLQTAEIIPAE